MRMSSILWVDSHFHPQYKNLGLESIKEAYDNGIAKMCCVATEISDHNFLMKAKMEYDVSVSLGEHPMNDFTLTDWCFLEKEIENYDAIGETGFDFQADINPQIEAFERQAFLAEKHDLPIILHIRDAGDGKVEEIAMHEIRKFNRLRGVFHCFVGTQRLANFAIEMDFFMSVSGIVTFKNANLLREVVKNIPKNLLLIETDSPYLAPLPKRGKVNHPMYVRYVGEFLSQFLHMDESELSNIVLENFDKLYKKPSVAFL